MEIFGRFLAPASRLAVGSCSGEGKMSHNHTIPPSSYAIEMLQLELCNPGEPVITPETRRAWERLRRETKRVAPKLKDEKCRTR